MRGMNGNVANIRKKIAGAFDLLMLFGRGIDAFSGTRRAALLSLIIPAALSPVSFFFCALYPPKGMEKGFSLQQIAATVALQTILSTVIATALIIAFAWMLNKLNKFWLFMEWLQLAHPCDIHRDAALRPRRYFRMGPARRNGPRLRHHTMLPVYRDGLRILPGFPGELAAGGIHGGRHAVC